MTKNITDSKLVYCDKEWCLQSQCVVLVLCNARHSTMVQMVQGRELSLITTPTHQSRSPRPGAGGGAGAGVSCRGRTVPSQLPAEHSQDTHKCSSSNQSCSVVPCPSEPGCSQGDSSHRFPQLGGINTFYFCQH